MKVREFEQAVWNLNTIRIVIRLPEDMEVHDYDYQRAAKRSMTFEGFKETNFRGWIDPKYIVAIDGSGNLVGDDAVLSEVRASYRRDDGC